MNTEARNLFEHAHGLVLRKRQVDAINVECLTDSELTECAAHPAVHMDVRRMAELTTAARECRLTGLMNRASKLEAKVERLYETLPRALRW